jgi:hypothetical protein
MDKKDIIRELIGIALEAGPSPAAVEATRLHFLEAAHHGAYQPVMERMFGVHPTVAVTCNGYFSDFLDLTPHPNGGWVASLCLNVLIQNPDQRSFARPRLLPGHVAAIESLFAEKCFVDSQLIHPAEIDAMPWEKWMDYVQGLFTDNAHEMPLQDSGEEPPGEGIFAPYSLVLHLWISDRKWEKVLHAAGAAVESILPILQQASGNHQTVPLTDVVPAHRGYTALEGAQTQVKLQRWTNLVKEGIWVVREEITEQTTSLTLSKEENSKQEAIFAMADSFPWINFVRWAILQSWFEEHPNVRLEQNKETLQNLDKELAEVPRVSYDPNPEDIISSVIGYTVLTENGPLLDSRNNVPLTLTSDQAAIVSLAIRTKTNEAYTVTPFPFIALYMLAAQGISLIALREAYVRLQDFCKHHAFENYKAVLPNVPGTTRWVQIDPEWIIPSARRQEFNETVGRQVREKVQKWMPNQCK